MNNEKNIFYTETTITIKVFVKAKYTPGSLATLEDPAEMPDVELQQIKYQGMDITSLVDMDESFDWEQLNENLSEAASDLEEDFDDYND